MNEIATEESGHAFLFHWLGYKVDRALVTRDDGQIEVLTDGPTVPVKALASFKTQHDVLIGLCAGDAACRVFTGGADESSWLGSTDREKALEIAKNLSGDNEACAELLVQWARKMAFMLVHRHRQKVQRLIDRFDRQSFGDGQHNSQQIDDALTGNLAGLQRFKE